MTRPQKIAVRGLKKSFGRKVVLDGIDLDVGVGESLVVIGGSGSGKSVLAKCILGLMQPDAGSIEIDGEEVTRLSGGERERVMRKFGMLFQSAALFDSLPVWENVAFGLIQGHGVARAEAKETAIEKLAAVGLGPEVASSVRRSSRAACRSAWRSRARSAPSPRSSSSTSPPPASIPS
jgi:phospholipid/cholesterol/gamma-HCH transport system ATP-binding protein